MRKLNHINFTNAFNYGSSAKQSNRKIIAQVLSVHSNPYSHQVVINRGTTDGISEGQAVIDEMGVVGQLTKVGSTTSRVLLMTDTTHATPVRTTVPPSVYLSPAMSTILKSTATKSRSCKETVRPNINFISRN